MVSLVLVECFPRQKAPFANFFSSLSSLGTPVNHISENRDLEIYGNPVWILFPYLRSRVEEFMFIHKFIANLNYQGILVLGNEEDSEEIMSLINKHPLKDKITAIFPEKEGSLSEDFFGVHLYNTKKTARMIATIVKADEEARMEYHAR